MLGGWGLGVGVGAEAGGRCWGRGSDLGPAAVCTVAELNGDHGVVIGRNVGQLQWRAEHEAAGEHTLVRTERRLVPSCDLKHVRLALRVVEVELAHRIEEFVLRRCAFGQNQETGDGTGWNLMQGGIPVANWLSPVRLRLFPIRCWCWADNEPRPAATSVYVQMLIPGLTTSLAFQG